MNDKFHQDVARAKEAAGLPADAPHDKATMVALRDHAENTFTENIGMPEVRGRVRFRFIPAALPGETGVVEARKEIDGHEFALASVRQDGWEFLHTRYRDELGKSIGLQAAKAGYVKIVREGNEVIATLTVAAPEAPEAPPEPESA